MPIEDFEAMVEEARAEAGNPAFKVSCSTMAPHRRGNTDM
jgi:hypothetical protein